MRSTMQDGVLSITSIFEFGANQFPNSKVVTYLGDGDTVFSFAETAKRVNSLANALASIGVNSFDRVGTFSFNNQQHLEAYFAVPSMGAVLHTLNLRLFQEQLTFVINDAEDKVIISDGIVVPLLAKVLGQTPSVQALIIAGNYDPSVLEPFNKLDVYDYEELIAAHSSTFNWPDIDEFQAAAMCYTSGTTGNPKGVVYSHRSTWLHSISACTSNTLGFNDKDIALLIVPMFHANGWGVPYSGWMAGSDLIMPSRFLQGEAIAKIIEQYRPTVSSGVPTIWNELLLYGESHQLDLSSLRGVTAGGSAVPLSLIERFKERYQLELWQGWGMTETSPICTVSIPPRGIDESQRNGYLVTAGRPSMGVEVRIVDDSGNALPRGMENLGEIEVRGPWIAASYYKSRSPESFDNGWLKTGDMGTLDAENYLRIVDRTKDVIKSGGEWISSVDLENALMSHPDVFEAAVIGIPDEKWVERPLACVVPRPGSTIDPDALIEYLSHRVAKWWLPERVSVVKEIPKTSVGKFDKKVLRAAFSTGQLETFPVQKH